MNPKWYNKQENNCHELFKKAEISVKKKKFYGEGQMVHLYYG